MPSSAKIKIDERRALGYHVASIFACVNTAYGRDPRPTGSMRRSNSSKHLPRLFSPATAVAFLFLSCGARLQSQVPSANPSTRERKITNASSLDGKKAFESICAACHGLDGRGGERGPDIARRQEVRRRTDSQLREILQRGRPAAGMPTFAALGAEKLQRILAYMRTLQGIGPASVLPGDPEQGKSLFFGKAGCSQCHMVNGSGGFLGADLSNYGASQSPAEIRNKILNINRDPDPRLRTVVVNLRNGSVLTGLARNEDNFSLQLQSLDGSFHLLNKSGILHQEVQPTTPMPSGYDALLGPAELDDLVKYLVHEAERIEPQP
jgi:cytochrome c oxidase cbb3-type subunit 3